MVEKTKGRKRHIVTDILGHLLGFIDLVANLRDMCEGQRTC
jgi:hypothetical protein